MLSLLDFTSKIWSSPALEKIVVIGAQHLMESTLTLFQHLKNLGLKPENTFLIGKSYSTCSEIVDEFSLEGFYISKRSLEFDSFLPYDDLYRAQIKGFIKDILPLIKNQKIEKIIVLDDGGYLIEEIGSIGAELDIPICCIEQTSSGISHIKKIPEMLKFPVINVARTEAKLKLETPYIVNSAIERLYDYLERDNRSRPDLLILGNGSIGACLKNMLGDRHFIETYDPKENDPSAYYSKIRQADIIIGCSGTTSLKFIDFPFLKKGVILASLSSSDREFEAHLFRRIFPRSFTSHMHYTNEYISLLESGCPINFWGSRNNIPLKYIQITLALLASAIFQAASNLYIGNDIVKFDEESERLICSYFIGLIEKENLKAII